MDEPSLGLAPIVVRGIFDPSSAETTPQGITVLLIEQNANRPEDRGPGYVLETGRITLTGSGRDLLKNEDVKKAYLGT